MHSNNVYYSNAAIFPRVFKINKALKVLTISTHLVPYVQFHHRRSNLEKESNKKNKKN